MPMHNPPHPGESLREDVLPALGMAEAEFAEHLGCPVERLAAALNCCNPISTGLVQCLKLASLWLAEHAAYDLWHSQQ